ncbi:MAG: helix-turn-helix domain-containing protein [Streptosporangiaceae bacterium]
MSIGEALATARQGAGLTVAQVSEATRVRETIIEAIEHDDFSLCGGHFYARGHIRAIAGVVGAESEPLVHEYDQTYGSPRGEPRPLHDLGGRPVSVASRHTLNWSAIMAVVLAVVVVLGLVQLFTRGVGSGDGGKPPVAHDRVSPSPTATPSSPSPSPTKNEKLALVPRGGVKVHVRASDETWMSVRDGSGQQLFQGLLYHGDAKTWDAHKLIKLTVGNAGGISIRVNGKDVGVPGEPGAVMHLSFGPHDPDAG